jgi:hypothetical protein
MPVVNQQQAKPSFSSSSSGGSPQTKPVSETVQLRKETLEPWYQHYLKLKDKCSGYLAEDYVVQTVRLEYQNHPNEAIMNLCVAMRKMFSHSIPPYNKRPSYEMINGMKAYRHMFKRAVNEIEVPIIQSAHIRDLCCGWAGTETKEEQENEEEEEEETPLKVIKRKGSVEPLYLQQEEKRSSPPPPQKRRRETEEEQQDNELNEILQKVLYNKKKIKIWIEKADEMEQQVKELRLKIESNKEIVADLVQKMTSSLLQQQ